MNGAVYYRHSGEVTSKGIVLGLVLGSLTALVLSVPYAYLTVHVPFVYLNLIATVFLGLGTGMMVGKGGRMGNLQAPYLYVIMGLVAGCLAIYFQWAFWLFALTRQKFLSFSPVDIIGAATDIQKTGTWGLRGGHAVSGLPLLGVWAAEAGIILFVSISMARDGIQSYFCCPKCITWFDKPKQTMTFEVPANLEGLKKDLEGLKFRSILDLKKVDPSTEPKYLSLELFFCPRCAKVGSFTLKSVTVVVKKKEVEKKSVTLINRIVIPMERLSELVA
jgi:hypothetical protein